MFCFGAWSLGRGHVGRRGLGGLSFAEGMLCAGREGGICVGLELVIYWVNVEFEFCWLDEWGILVILEAIVLRTRCSLKYR